MESGSDGFTVRPSLEAGSKKRKWTGMEEVQHRWLTGTTKEIELDWCAWDLHCQYGQTRSLDQGYVGRLKAILEERPPTAPVRVSVWENTPAQLDVLGGGCQPVVLHLLRPSPLPLL